MTDQQTDTDQYDLVTVREANAHFLEEDSSLPFAPRSSVSHDCQPAAAAAAGPKPCCTRCRRPLPSLYKQVRGVAAQTKQIQPKPLCALLAFDWLLRPRRRGVGPYALDLLHTGAEKNP